MPRRTEPALFQANRLEVSIRLLPLLRGNVRLREFVLDQPVVHLKIDSQGRSNVPSARQSSTESVPDTIFDLDVQNCVIHSGEIYYNDARIPLEADLHDLKFQSRSRPLTGEYAGSLSYDKGHLMAQQVYSITHAAQLDFVASRSGAARQSPFTYQRRLASGLQRPFDELREPQH